jgi:hypothetical protein
MLDQNSSSTMNIYEIRTSLLRDLLVALVWLVGCDTISSNNIVETIHSNSLRGNLLGINFGRCRHSFLLHGSQRNTGSLSGDCNPEKSERQRGRWMRSNVWKQVFVVNGIGNMRGENTEKSRWRIPSSRDSDLEHQ